jgi:hypothetical protein
MGKTYGMSPEWRLMTPRRSIQRRVIARPRPVPYYHGQTFNAATGVHSKLGASWEGFALEQTIRLSGAEGERQSEPPAMGSRARMVPPDLDGMAGKGAGGAAT